MGFEFLSDEKTYQAGGRYLYSGAFNGFLATGGLFFYTAFLLSWPITTAFTITFVVTTTFTTLAAIYLLYRGDARANYLQAMNDKTKKIKQLFNEIHYYENKLQREQTLLQSRGLNPDAEKCISEKDLDHIRAKIRELKALYDETKEDSLPQIRNKAASYVGGFIQRHIIGTYKAFITSYVFYLSFPLFIALAINAIIAPAWLAPLVIPIFVAATALGVFGLFKSYLDESREITTYDAALKESEWIENSAKKLVESCEALIDNKDIHEKRELIYQKEKVEINRKNSVGRKDVKHFLIKKGQELLARIPVLNWLVKPLGERLPKSAFEIASPDTYGKRIGETLHKISEYFYQWTLLSTITDFFAKLTFMSIMGAIIPGGVALYLKFVLGVTFTPLLVNIYIGGLITTTVASVIFSFFSSYWDRQEALLKEYSDHVAALTIEVTEDLNQLHKERTQLAAAIANRTDNTPRLSVIDKKSREIIQERKHKLQKATRKLREQSDKMNEDNFLMSFVKWTSIIFNSVTTGYAWYMGFPLFVFLTLVTFVPITAPLITYSIFTVSLFVGVLGIVHTFDTAAQGVDASNAMINEGKTQSEAADNLLKHYEKVLLDKDLSKGEKINYSYSNETLIKLTPPEMRDYTQLPVDYSQKFELLKALRMPPKPGHFKAQVNDLIGMGNLAVPSDDEQPNLAF